MDIKECLKTCDGKYLRLKREQRQIIMRHWLKKQIRHNTKLDQQKDSHLTTHMITLVWLSLEKLNAEFQVENETPDVVKDISGGYFVQEVIEEGPYFHFGRDNE